MSPYALETLPETIFWLAIGLVVVGYLVADLRKNK